MTVTSRNLQVITGRASREGARERVCFAQKPIAATKMAMWTTQQPQRGGTTSCASRPSAGIDRAKCLISLKATVALSSPVALNDINGLAGRNHGSMPFHHPDTAAEASYAFLFLHPDTAGAQASASEILSAGRNSISIATPSRGSWRSLAANILIPADKAIS